MSHENDDRSNADRMALLEAQLAGLTGVVTAVIACAPRGERARIQERVMASFEGLQAALLNDDGPQSESALRGVANLQAAFAGEFARNADR